MAASVALAGIRMLLLGVPRSPLPSLILLSAVAIGLSSLDGFAGPYTFGLSGELTGNSYYGMVCAGTFFLISVIMALILPKQVQLTL